MNARAKAANLIDQVIQKNRSLTTLLANQKKESKDQALIQELCFGTLRWYFKLKPIAEKLLHSPLKNKDNNIFCLILIGFYQLEYLNIPTHAAVSQTVDAAQSLRKAWAKGLVNKLLRRFINEKEKLIIFAEKTLEGQYAHPSWLIEKIKSSWPDHWLSILKANNARAPMTLRINLTKIGRDDYMRLLNDHGISAKKLDFLPAAIELENPRPAHQLPGFDKGYCYIQDASGQFAAYLLNLEKAQIVLDACAAPGSKTTHILELNQSLKKLMIIDKSPQRLNRIKENISRLGLTQKPLQFRVADATQTKQWAKGETFDRILLDAPCSATGVIRRHPDIKLLRKPTDIPPYHQQQLHLLNSLWPLLKEEGFLLYATCSVLSEENENVITEFLSDHADAQPSAIKVPGAIQLTHGLQLLPGESNRDGFYYAQLKKRIIS